MTWLDKVMNFYKDTESPRRYFYWAAISAVGAATKRNVWIDKKRYRLYPNLFVLLIGRSGLRKGLPIGFARQTAQKVDSMRVFYGRNSIEGIMSDLAKAKSKPGGQIEKDAIAFLISSEFATFLIKNPDALTILTDWYDSHFGDEWKNVLKNSPLETLTNLGISLLGASSEIHLKNVVPLNAVGGGFLARTLIVYEEQKAGIHSLIGDDEEVVAEDASIVSDLAEIAKRKGEIKVSKEAALAYNAWYQDYSKAKVSDRTGTYERLHDHILKVMMILALIEGSDITVDHVDEAVAVCLECFSGVQRVFFETGTHQFAPIVALVLRVLLNAPEHQATKRYILRNHWREVDYLDLDKAIEHLFQAQMITVHHGGIYRLTSKVAGQLDKFIEKEISHDIE